MTPLPTDGTAGVPSGPAAMITPRSRAHAWRFENAARDTAYALRALRRSPGFTAVALTTLALGIGANASVFSVLDRLIVRTPPGVGDATNVRRLHQRFAVPMTREVRSRDMFSHPEADAIARSLPQRVRIAGYSTRPEVLGRDSDLREVRVTSVVGDYFAVLGVAPATGRFFALGEAGRVGPNPLAVISEQLWTAHFGRSRDIVGRMVTLGSRRFTVIGVAPRGFRGVDLDAADLWIPFNASPEVADSAGPFSNRFDLRLKLIARARSRGDMAALGAAAERALRELNIIRDPAAVVRLAPIAEMLDPQQRAGTLAIVTSLLGAAISLLLVACANVANLLTMRSSQRRREIAIRSALGGSRARLAGQLITESLTLALLAGAVALFVGWWGGTALRNALFPDVAWGTGTIDVRVVVAVAMLALLVGMVGGLAPVLYLGDRDVASALKVGGAETTARRSRLGAGALMLQTALSVVLLAAAGLFVRSFRHVEQTNIGYRTDDLLMVTASAGASDDRYDPVIAAGWEHLSARITRLPGVERSALSAITPIGGIVYVPHLLPGRDSVPSHFPTAVTIASPDFLATMGVRVLRGRAFTADDRKGAEPVVLVSALMAQQYWPGRDAIGKCIILFQRSAPCRRVVGVVEDVHAMRIIERPTMRFYLPMAQNEDLIWMPPVLLIRVAPGRMRDVLPLIRVTVFSAGQHGRSFDIKAFSDLLAPELRPWRLSATLFTALGVLALIIAGVGIYGTVAYATSRRTHEIGVRRALGADRAHIMGLVISQVMGLVVIGILAGVGVAALFGRLAKTLLYNVTPLDPMALGIAAGTLVAACCVACIVPTRHALRVDPTVALAAE